MRTHLAFLFILITASHIEVCHSQTIPSWITSINSTTIENAFNTGIEWFADWYKSLSTPDPNRVFTTKCKPDYNPNQAAPTAYEVSFKCNPWVISRVDGCSNPLSDPTSEKYKKVFQAACFAHDICYSSPWSLKYPSDSIAAFQHCCDGQFLHDMLQICDHDISSNPFDPEHIQCEVVANQWKSEVSKFGDLGNGDEWAKQHCTIVNQ